MNKSVNNSVNMTKNSRLGQLQTLRFFAFMLIFLWHGDVWCNRFFPRGKGAAMAVSFFFILSGFVVGYSCYGKKIKVSVGEIGKYMKKKILKLYPLYLLTTLFAAIFSELPACLLRGDFKGMLTPGTQLLKNLFLVQSWFPANKGYFSYNSLGWFLSSLMFLYLINIPLMALLNKYKPKIWKLVITACGLYAVMVLYSYGVRNTNMELPIQHKLGPLNNVMSLVICFAMTVLAAYIYNRLETYYKKSC